MDSKQSRSSWSVSSYRNLNSAETTTVSSYKRLISAKAEKKFERSLVVAYSVNSTWTQGRTLMVSTGEKIAILMQVVMRAMNKAH